MMCSSMLATVQDNLNIHGFLQHFGRMSSSLKAVYFGNINENCAFVTGALQRGHFIPPS